MFLYESDTQNLEEVIITAFMVLADKGNFTEAASGY